MFLGFLDTNICHDRDGRYIESKENATIKEKQDESKHSDTVDSGLSSDSL